jgi:hypothetical protein
MSDSRMCTSVNSSVTGRRKLHIDELVSTEHWPARPRLWIVVDPDTRLITHLQCCSIDQTDQLAQVYRGLRQHHAVPAHLIVDNTHELQGRWRGGKGDAKRQ